MKAQARAFLERVAEQKLECRTIIRDMDGKFTKEFTSLLRERGIAVKKVGPQAPDLNAFVERWIQSLKHEALNHFIVFGLEHFDHIVSEYVAYSLECRPHQGIGNRLIGEAAPVTHLELRSLDEIRCEPRLGGLLKHYSRAA
jgi:putative transposase